MTTLDPTDARILLALDADPRTPVIELAARLGLARKTVQTRLARFGERSLLRQHSGRVPPRELGYSVTALVTAQVHQPQLQLAVRALRSLPEVLEAAATTGEGDLMCRVVAYDSEDLFRVGQLILACPGIQRTATTVIVRDLIPYRTTDLLRRHAEDGAGHRTTADGVGGGARPPRSPYVRTGGAPR